MYGWSLSPLIRLRTLTNHCIYALNVTMLRLPTFLQSLRHTLSLILKSHDQKYKFYHTGDTSYHGAEWVCPKNTGLTYRGLQWYHRKRVFNAEDTPSLSCQSSGSNISHIPAWPIHFYKAHRQACGDWFLVMCVCVCACLHVCVELECVLVCIVRLCGVCSFM